MHDITAALNEAQRMRPDNRAGREVTNDRPEPEPLSDRDRDDRRQQIDKGLVKSAVWLSNYKLAKPPLQFQA